ncbi:transketolase [candidate division TA06 bacterium DG_26]|uniref:Transketolase n=1 Tax=candidate division TA06 bacterium DG_26 TaxID=1703771 RepID=A0A0S7WLS8_UNCT6|nr:MAG: transketolase [candidate division TA06 bacterium DG_26]
MTEFDELKDLAKSTRREIISMIAKAGSGHPGGSLSIVEILVYLYSRELRVNPEDPEWDDRDRVVLSKGHGAPALYAVLALKRFFPLSELSTLRRLDSRLQGHPDMLLTPGIDMTTGSLGQGLSVANGMAIGSRLRGKRIRVFAIIGDGECQEGQIWEAAMAAGYHKLDNLICFLDHNRLQLDGPTEKIMDLEPLADKWRAFNWNVQEIDGHDFVQIQRALERAKKERGAPHLILAHTVKGKGVSFMEHNPVWHGKAPKPEELKKALEEFQNG